MVRGFGFFSLIDWVDVMWCDCLCVYSSAYHNTILKSKQQEEKKNLSPNWHLMCSDFIGFLTHTTHIYTHITVQFNVGDQYILFVFRQVILSAQWVLPEKDLHIDFRLISQKNTLVNKRDNVNQWIKLYTHRLFDQENHTKCFINDDAWHANSNQFIDNFSCVKSNNKFDSHSAQITRKSKFIEANDFIFFM